MEGNREVGGQNMTLGSPGVRKSGVSDRGRLQGHGSGDHSITTHLPTDIQHSLTSRGLVKLLLTLSVCSFESYHFKCFFFLSQNSTKTF